MAFLIKSNTHTHSLGEWCSIGFALWAFSLLKLTLQLSVVDCSI